MPVGFCPPPSRLHRLHCLRRRRHVPRNRCMTLLLPGCEEKAPHQVRALPQLGTQFIAVLKTVKLFFTLPPENVLCTAGWRYGKKGINSMNPPLAADFLDPVTDSGQKVYNYGNGRRQTRRWDGSAVPRRATEVLICVNES
jgi:hypothetical protein